MSNFDPGKIVFRFESKSGKPIVIRYPQWSDIDELTRYINKLSKEDTYITFSGEIVSRDQEMEYLLSCYRGLEKGDSVVLYACEGDKIIGSSDIHRVFSHRRRGMHVGSFGITVENEYREQGIGYTLAKNVIEEAKHKIQGLEMVILDVYSENARAIAMYEKLGFMKAGEIPRSLKYKENYLNEVKMYLQLG